MTDRLAALIKYVVDTLGRSTVRSEAATVEWLRSVENALTYHMFFQAEQAETFLGISHRTIALHCHIQKARGLSHLFSSFPSSPHPHLCHRHHFRNSLNNVRKTHVRKTYQDLQPTLPPQANLDWS